MQQQIPIQLKSETRELLRPHGSPVPSDSSLVWPAGPAIRDAGQAARHQVHSDGRLASDGLGRGKAAVALPYECQTTTRQENFNFPSRPPSTAGGTTPPRSSMQHSRQHVSRSASLEQGQEEVHIPAASRPPMRPSPQVCALDYTVNSKLLANLGPNDVWCGTQAQTSTETGRGGFEGSLAHQDPPKGTEYFDKDCIDQFMKQDESAEFMRLVDVGGEALLMVLQLSVTDSFFIP